MTHYNIDERDMMFNLLECPGLQPLQALEAFDDPSEDTLRMVFDQAAKFANEVLAPLLIPADREGCEVKDGVVSLPAGIKEAFEQYRELGYIGMTISSEVGGLEMPHFFSMPVSEMECGSFCSFSMLPLLTRGSARLIYSFGNQELKDMYCERMFTGEWTGTMCLTEPGAGSDVGAGVTKAVPDGDHYKITGTKIFITWGEHSLTDNIIHLVLARIQGAPAGSKGLSLFVVPKYRVDDEGNVIGSNDVECGSIEHKMGINASPTCLINFGAKDDDCHGYLLGEAGKGMQYMFQMMNEARLEVGVQGQAQASAAFLSAVNYAKERTQGIMKDENGVRQAKIVEHPDVRRMLLKMRAISEGCRSLLYHMGLYMDIVHHGEGEHQAKHQALVDLLVPICKSYCSDQGFKVSELAIQTYGGYGYCQEYPVEQYMRDLKISSIYEGTNGIQAMDLVFRKILMDKGEKLKVFAGEVQQVCQAVGETQLKDLAGSLGAALQTVVDTAMHFGGLMAQGKDEEVRFMATDFQDQMGHVVLCYFLLKQAHIAQRALDNGATGADATFYQQKIVTTRYAFEDILPVAVSALKLLQRKEISGLEAAF
jgi:alkylation response protein AidB-like acyl-CoA dehydrogenase